VVLVRVRTAPFRDQKGLIAGLQKASSYWKARLGLSSTVAVPTLPGTELLPTLATELGKLPNKISIEGYTDSKPYAGARDYGNWELSADRANAARRLMQRDGLGPNQVSQVRGFADQELRKKEEPLDPSNRRITLIVQFIVRDADEDSLKRAAPPGGAKPAIGKSEEKGQ
jgi:chemotaxis protein MotB